MLKAVDDYVSSHPAIVEVVDRERWDFHPSSLGKFLILRNQLTTIHTMAGQAVTS
jgi:hypothetical protein